MIKKLIILSAITVFFGANAQQTHTVTKGDTAYNIAKKYGMSLGDLAKMNPTVQDGNIQIGQVLNVKGKAQTSVSTKKTTEVGYIILQPKQTIYGLTKQYHISESDLRALNPEIDQNMKIGNKIALPLDLIKKYGEGQPVASAEPQVVTETAPENVAKVADENSYIVQPKDNYYRVTRKFNLTQNQLFALNPGLEQKGLQVGDVIKINGDIVTKNNNTTPTPKNTTYTNTSVSDDYVTYTVKSGDTVFGILNHFGVSLDDLLSLNPQLSGGLKTGMVLKIKKLQAQYVKKSGDALNVAIMLPFGFDTNDSKFRAMSTDFLTGAKLAIERNVAKGQKLNINVVDAG
ncbi:MAG: LysM peptidoglycan-binding domain-containing protein, partial [Cruoricaptor ignavus]|nr:LysM peptidoglycan-binding domain-containing protein [Cruoricaptor ignavus]